MSKWDGLNAGSKYLFGREQGARGGGKKNPSKSEELRAYVHANIPLVQTKVYSVGGNAKRSVGVHA